ncbi:hypothetical protein EU537_04085 [Candidatus Thorarchaeota archaeon]|nr:MAG: hypothetical protein EU537_04085 [Candidatus Thorarchaeota archaeon]
MSKKGRSTRTKPGEQSLDEFQFTPKGINLKWTKDFITVFDGYRIHRCFDLTFIEKAIGQGALPRSFVSQWRFIRTVLHKFAAVSPKVPGVLKFYERRKFLQHTALILMTIAVPSIVATWVFSLVSIAPYTIAFTAFAFLFFVAQWTAGHYYNRKVAWIIEDYWDEHPDLLKEERQALKSWVQRLIVHARHRLRKEDEDPEEHPVKFYNDDYEGIIVKNEPNWYRKHYTVQIVVDK